MKQSNRARRQRSKCAQLWPNRRRILADLMRAVEDRLKREPLKYQIDEFSSFGQNR
jgi:hypothetical protein